MITPQEEQKRRHASQVSLKHLELEGMYPSKEMLEDIELLDTGKITEEDFLTRCIARAKKINDEQRSLRLSGH